jgi:hypothetical protein
MRAAAIKNDGQALQTIERLDLGGLAGRVQKLRASWEQVDGLRSVRRRLGRQRSPLKAVCDPAVEASPPASALSTTAIVSSPAPTSSSLGPTTLANIDPRSA